MRPQLDLFTAPEPAAATDSLETPAPPTVEDIPLAAGMVRLGCGTCGKRGGWTMKAGPDAGKWRICPDCGERGWRDVPERQPLDPALALAAKGTGYDAEAALALIAFAQAVKALGNSSGSGGGDWNCLVTEPAPVRVWPDYPNPARSDGTWPKPEQMPARLLSIEKAARLANLILRGVASDKPRPTAEGWRRAMVCLPEFYREYRDPFGDGWQAPLDGEAPLMDVRKTLAKAFPGDLTDNNEEDTEP